MLDAQLTKTRIQGEARALVRCMRAGVTVPEIKFVDADAGFIGMEWIEGWSVREVLGAGEEGDEDDDEIDDAKAMRRKDAEGALGRLGIPAGALYLIQ